MEEIWRDIPEYEGFYKASNFGRVKSLGNGKTRKEKILKFGWMQAQRGKRYYFVYLCKYGKRTKYQVSHIVAITFPEICGKWFDGAEINHKDENPANNCANNLEWCNRAHNNNWGTRTIRAASKLSKPVKQLTKNGDEISTFISLNEASRITNIPVQNIQKCCTGERYSAGGYVWVYN